MTRRKQPFLRKLGQGILVVVLLPLVLPLALFAVANHLIYRALLYLLVWALWLPRGKDILFVYSDSPIWHDYMATQVLPLVQRQNFFLDIPLQELGQQLLSNQQTGLAKFLAPVTPPLAQSTAFIELIDL
jgi:hypothetical protein